MIFTELTPAEQYTYLKPLYKKAPVNFNIHVDPDGCIELSVVSCHIKTKNDLIKIRDFFLQECGIDNINHSVVKGNGGYSFQRAECRHHASKYIIFFNII